MERKIIQRDSSELNDITTLITSAELQSIPDPRRWIPTIIPDVSEDRQRLQKQGITVERVNLAKLPTDEQTLLLLKTAKIYGEVFAGPPWNETPDPINMRAQLIEKDLTRPDTQLLLVKNKEGDIKGFSWAYTTSPKELVDEKWETAEMRDRVLRVLEDLDIQPEDPVTYFAEAGIAPELRGLGISNIFYAERLQSAKELGYPVLVRTKAQTPINVLAEEFGMIQIFGPKVKLGYRRDGARSINVKANTFYGGIDTEEPDRVLYALAGIR